MRTVVSGDGDDGCAEQGASSRSRLEETYQGLTRRLRFLFWPDTEEDPSKRSAGESHRRRRTPPKVPLQRSSCQLHSAAHGTIVHQQIALAAACITSSLDVAAAVANFCTRCRGVVDPCTVRFLRLLVDEAWVPIHAEYPVFYEPGRVATQIDLLVFDSRSAKVLALEIKTGYEAEFYGPIESDPTFYAPLDGVKNCPYTRHQLQLASSLQMLQHQAAIVPPRGYLVRLFPRRGGTQLLPLQPWATSEKTRQCIERCFRVSRA